MNWLMADALAQGGAAPSTADSLLSLLFPIGLIVILYFLMIRPQIKRQKEHKALVEGLARGDEVLTIGGVAGRIIDLGDNFVQIEIAEGVAVKVRRHAVEAVLPKGSLREL